MKQYWFGLGVIFIALIGVLVVQAPDRESNTKDIHPERGYIATLPTEEPLPLPHGQLASTSLGEPTVVPSTASSTVVGSTSIKNEQGIERCVIGGCSSHICSDQPGLMTTCEWLPEYSCYAAARCERQLSGLCGWTETEELLQCLASAGRQAI